MFFKKPIKVSYPTFVYDASQHLFFPINYVISGLCHLQPKKSVWNKPDYAKKKLKGSGKSFEELTHDIINNNLVYNEEDLVLLYDSLPAVSAQDDLIGKAWHGKVLRTNASVLDLAQCLFVKPMSKVGIKWGKRYKTSEKGDPLFLNVCDKFYFPVPIWGNVGMTDIRWRGTATATMNYDHQPWKDYFKLLSDKDGKIVLLGVWTHKHIAGGWFTLTLNKDIKA